MSKTKIEWKKLAEEVENEGSDGHGLIVAYHLREKENRVLRIGLTFYPEPDTEITNYCLREMCQEIAKVFHKWLDR